ncbi:hypothetical protein CIHG_08141 [Coccidioides immitis H538.4]|uniref:Uncharacterized protein n=3 Tax=Coccidioides immitis TaxID=5501 RepID=A0A0J8QKR4_COCIT|nr:hypothetical protein CIRG_02060 [Coccidioides immitis RMSCC 2394]KMU73001.1 hypothetical protein CISG_09882 [Coccidioides immitis RMSCC 3703]KMU90332.1 hypothetical protein CIHG_08141 [Coccidioides immitis H538.4]
MGSKLTNVKLESFIGDRSIQRPIQGMVVMVFNHTVIYAFREFAPFSYPNVLDADYLGALYGASKDRTQEERVKRTAADIDSLALAVNLQLARRNSYVFFGG